MSKKVVMAIDPGGTSGIALRLPDGEIRTCVAETQFKSAGVITFDPTQLYEMLSMPGIEQIVYERFQAETITKYGLHTVRLVGAIEAVAYCRGIPCKGQDPGARRAFMKEAKELLAGKRAVIHQVDALAHLLRFEYDMELR